MYDIRDVRGLTRPADIMEWYRSGHNEHDWKSCDGQKPSEGSNPSHSAKIGDVCKNIADLLFHKGEVHAEQIRDCYGRPAFGELSSQTSGFVLSGQLRLYQWRDGSGWGRTGCLYSWRIGAGRRIYRPCDCNHSPL